MHSITYIFSDADIDHIIDIELNSYFYVLLCELLIANVDALVEAECSAFKPSE